MKKIVIFGSTGHIGAYTFEYLKEKIGNDYEFVLSGRRKTNFFDKYNVKYINVDICNKNDFDKLPQNDFFCVVHLAGNARNNERI